MSNTMTSTTTTQTPCLRCANPGQPIDERAELRFPPCQRCKLNEQLDRVERGQLWKVPDLHGVTRARGRSPVFANGVSQLHQRAVLVGTWRDVAPHVVRGALVHGVATKGLAELLCSSRPFVDVVTDADLRAMYFREPVRSSRGEAPPKFEDIIRQPKLLVVRLGHYIMDNPALPGVVHEAVSTRLRYASRDGLLTWLVTEPVQPWGRSHRAFSKELDAVLKEEFTTITIAGAS